MGRLMPYRYTGENKRAENDQYFTPPEPVEKFCRYIEQVKPYSVAYPATILDPCAGTGVWGNTYKSIFNHSTLYGIDIDTSLEKPEGFDFWQTGSFLDSNLTNKKFDIIISNPPFNLAEKFVHEGFKHLASYGLLAYLLPLAFLSSIGRNIRVFNANKNPNEVIVSSRRIDFTGQGNPHTNVAMFIWYDMELRQYGTVDTEVTWLDWAEDVPEPTSLWNVEEHKVEAMIYE